MCVNRVEQHLVGKSHKPYSLIDEYSFKTKNLYNYANYLIRQTFIITTRLSNENTLNKEQQDFLNNINSKVDKFNNYKKEILLKKQSKGKDLDRTYKNLPYYGKEHKYLGYGFLEFLCSEGKDYKELMASVAQQILRLLDKNWASFFNSIKDWKENPQKYKGMPKLPKYKNKVNGRYSIVFTNQNCRIEDGFVKFPTCFNTYKLKTRVKDRLLQVRVNPIGSQYMMEVVYEKEVPDLQHDMRNVVGIDLGVNNFITMTNNVGKVPVVINGRIIKSVNQYYNKKLAYYKSTLKKETGKNWSKGLERLTLKRNNKIKDFIHKSSRFVVNYCLENGIDTIIVGNNKDWKQGVDMSKVNNQNFVQIPFEMLISQLIYKGQEVGIRVVVTEESYTSKASFLDNDFIPKYDPNNTINYKFSGYRVKRGLYKSKLSKKFINADVNGSYNIMRKVVPEALADGIEGVGLHPVRYNIA